jgi:hypothetical protein
VPHSGRKTVRRQQLAALKHLRRRHLGATVSPATRGMPRCPASQDSSPPVLPAVVDHDRVALAAVFPRLVHTKDVIGERGPESTGRLLLIVLMRESSPADGAALTTFNSASIDSRTERVRSTDGSLTAAQTLRNARRISPLDLRSGQERNYCRSLFQVGVRTFCTANWVHRECCPARSVWRGSFEK